MRVAVDIGGTFSDVVGYDERRGTVTTAKALTTPRDLTEGLLESFRRAGVTASDASLIVHGTTIVINAVIERRGATAALVTTQGFGDVYKIGRINRPESFNLFFRRHQPLIPRELVFEVPERVLADGSVETPLDEDVARRVAREIRERGIDSVAILFLHSYGRPDHELRMAEILTEEDGRLFTSPSHELTREYREYERTSTVAANAYVGPVVNTYLAGLEKRLAADGFRGELLMMQSNGGLCDLQTAQRQCVQLMESGPAGGVVGTGAVCDAIGVDQAIAWDMGGTTAKAAVVRRGVPGLSPEYFVGGYNEGLAIRIPVVDITEVGIGGGSVAWTDEAEALHVGPHSAGADPGPACYGRGGSEPTITDAGLVLGHLPGRRSLAGGLELNPRAAVEAIRRRVADPLRMEPRRAARGMLSIARASMANAIRAVTTERGLDPRDFTLVAYGGAGPLHAVAVARELNVGQVVIPPAPANFSAFGMLLADLRREYVRTWIVRLADVQMPEFERRFQALEDEGAAALSDSGVPADRIHFARALDMRYVGQEHSVTAAAPADVTTDGARDEIKARFDGAHHERFSHSAPDEPAEIVSLRVSAIGSLAKPPLPTIAAASSDSPEAALIGDRDITFHGGEDTLSCPVYDRAKLLAGTIVPGPAAIDEDASTTLVGRNDVASIDRHGNIVIAVGGEA